MRSDAASPPSKGIGPRTLSTLENPAAPSAASNSHKLRLKMRGKRHSRGRSSAARPSGICRVSCIALRSVEEIDHWRFLVSSILPSPDRRQVVSNQVGDAKVKGAGRRGGLTVGLTTDRTG